MDICIAGEIFGMTDLWIFVLDQIFALLVEYLAWQINGYLRYIRYLRCWLKGCSKIGVPWIAIFASGYIPGHA